MNTSKSTGLLVDKLRVVRKGGPLLPTADANPAPAGLEAAYRIADELVAIDIARWGQVGGYKIGANNPAGQQQLGLAEPFFGRVPAGRIVASGAPLPLLPIGCTIEAEVGIRMAADLPSRSRPYVGDDIRRAVGGFLPLFEINRPSYAEPFQVGGLFLVADNGVTQALVTGGAKSCEQVGPWSDEQVSMSRNATVCAECIVGARVGDPLDVVLWLANALSKRGAGLKQGDIVASGALTPPTPFAPGDRVLARFTTLGEVGFVAGDWA